MKDIQCYELFGGIALKNHAFSFIMFSRYFLGSISLLFFKICLVFKVWLLVSKGMLLVRYICSNKASLYQLNFMEIMRLS